MCAVVCFVCASTQADLEFLAGQIARLVTQAQRLNAQLLNRTLSRKEADALRAHYRETTAQLAAAAVRRRKDADPEARRANLRRRTSRRAS